VEEAEEGDERDSNLEEKNRMSFPALAGVDKGKVQSDSSVTGVVCSAAEAGPLDMAADYFLVDVKARAADYWSQGHCRFVPGKPSLMIFLKMKRILVSDYGENIKVYWVTSRTASSFPIARHLDSFLSQTLFRRG
jgi:hypothetical protein